MMPMSTTTASVTVSSWSNTGSARRVSQPPPKIDAAIDEYAQRSLQRMAGGDDYYVDDALGSYVTSCIRSSIGSFDGNIVALPEYEPLCELIQEHCPAMDVAAITVLLQTILDSIIHRQLPEEEEEAVPQAAPASSYAPSQVRSSVPSEPSPHVISPYSAGWKQEEEDDDQAPELRPYSIPTSPPPPPPSTLRDYGAVTRNADPTRSVEGEEEEASYSTTHAPLPAVLDPALRRQKQDAYRAVLDQQRREYQVADRLFRAGGISHAAAVAAAALGNGPVAQYLLHQAAAQVPVCRHLLTDGCYRADCAFSHDIARHTCLFWMKPAGCAKGEDCRFLHGFSEVLLEHMPEEYRTLPNEDYDWDEDEDDAPVHIPSSQHSFANIASQGYHQRQSYPEPPPSAVVPRRPAKPPTVPIPQHLWQPHRDPSAFGIADPLERYAAVAAMWKPQRPSNVMDLHYQSLQTFPVVLDTMLPELLRQHEGVWIITGTGHHVAERGHQKRHVSTLEAAVWEYLQYYYYDAGSYRIAQGRDRNGQGGALLLQKL